MATRKAAWGGSRVGAGRKPGPRGLVRRHRVVVMLTDAELARLRRAARGEGVPLGALAYRVLAAWLNRRA